MSKQPGRRYGPAPKAAPRHRQSPSPMSSSARIMAYQQQNGRLLGLTARQRRQLNRMSLRAVRAVRES